MFSKSTIKYIQSLQHKKFRDEFNVFIAEGPKVIIELLQAGIFRCKAVYALQDWVSGLDDHIADLIKDRIEIVKDFELLKIAAYSTPNKAIAVFEKRPSDENITLKNKCTLVLDDIRDPGNFGTIIRTADWFAIENIICSVNTVDMYNPKVVQSTMASLGRVNIVYTDLLEWLKKAKDVRKFAATLDGKSIKDLGSLKEGVIIIGNESKGISPQLMELADEKITIPKTGSAESLNAAVATAIILYAISNCNS